MRDRLQAGLELQRARQRRQLTGWVLAGAAVAATLLLAIAFGWHWKRTHPPRLDLELVAADFFAETANPVAGNVEAFFHQTDRAFLAPQDFNYANLRYYAWSDLQGRRVPMLLFALSDKREQPVYFLS